MENLNMPALQFSPEIEINQAGYPLYPVSEEIYPPSKEASDTDPEDTTRLKDPNEPEKQNEKKLEGDNADEITGSEDEKNNDSSLDGNVLNNPEEDHGE